jgi:hypothetical protein
MTNQRTAAAAAGDDRWWTSHGPFSFLFFISAVGCFMNQPSPFYFGVLGPIRSIGCECEVINITGCHAARCVDCLPSGVSLWFTTLVSVNYTPLFCFYFFCEWCKHMPHACVRPTCFLCALLFALESIWTNTVESDEMIFRFFRIILTIYGWKIYSEWRERRIGGWLLFHSPLFYINKETIKTLNVLAEP